jgi:hypothetical protein
MPDERRHRGPHPEDERLFAPSNWPVLAQATADFSWLLTRGYAHESALKLVGDRYGLAARQRLAVARYACGDSERSERRRRQAGPMDLPGCPLWLDGYNVLTTIEAALSGGVILAARDGTYRDMASMHGSYRKVAETLPALELLAATIAALGEVECVWYFDRPVSNSGRLKRLIEALAAYRGWPWRVELVSNPDNVLIAADAAPAPGVIIASADSGVLDRCGRWYNLARDAVTRGVADPCLVDLSGV